MSETIAILIVDDEESIRELLQVFLSPKYDCAMVDGAEAALALMQSKAFDLVLLDMCLTGISGLELCSVIKERWPRTLIAMMSGFRSAEATERALRRGVFTFLYKPLDLSEVSKAVQLAAHLRAEANRGAA